MKEDLHSLTFFKKNWVSMASLIDRMLRNSKCKRVSTLDKSSIYEIKDFYEIKTKILNVAFSGRLDGGLIPGLSLIAGPSKHFKSLLGLSSVAAFMEREEESICIFYDTEFGSSKEYWESFLIDPSRVIHVPIVNIEELKFDLMTRFDEDDKDSIKSEDKVIIFIDSVGNLSSKKEMTDAKEGKSVADMTRAKELKSLWRMVTPYINLLGIPLICVAHTYKTMDMYPQDVVSGGTGNMYSSNSVFIISRSKVKDGRELTGFTFKIKIEKSRLVKEGSVFPFVVDFKNGLSNYSGLFDLALSVGTLKMVSSGWYSVYSDGEILSNKKFRRKEIEFSSMFWEKVLENTNFDDLVESEYLYKDGSLFMEE